VRVALVHDWLLTMGGAERVLEQVAALYPAAPIYAVIANPTALAPSLAGRTIVQSWIARLPRARWWYRRYLPLMPRAVEAWDLSAFDLVLSDCSAVAKGVITRSDAVHVSYVHTPMRYLWDLEAEYRRGAGLAAGLAMSATFPALRRWDRAAAERPTALMANSHAVARRIRTHYGRGSRVVFPPVAVDRFNPGRARGDYLLVLSRLVGYKRLDLAVRAASALRLPLVVAGEGPERPRLEQLAGPSVRFVGRPSDAEAVRLLEEARALLLPGEEDFGIVMAEALAAGAPVVACAAGGALDIVTPGTTGVLFSEPTVDAVVGAVQELLGLRFDPDRLHRSAERFSAARFRAEYQAAVHDALAGRIPR
jgi:glycosyltransferase involved in cell wall biosynthesis